MRWFFIFTAFLVSCSDESISGFANRDTVYRLVEIDGEVFSARATIAFPEPGRAHGEGPCNAWSAPQTVPYPWIMLGPIAATKRACPDLQAEGRYFAALGAVTLAEVAGDVLILSSDDGLEMVFNAE